MKTKQTADDHVSLLIWMHIRKCSDSIYLMTNDPVSRGIQESPAKNAESGLLHVYRDGETCVETSDR